jgi:hypothetical protein
MAGASVQTWRSQADCRFLHFTNPGLLHETGDSLQVARLNATTGDSQMLPDGFYGVRFKTPRGEGAGVVTLAKGQLRGGDSALIYSGTFEHHGDDFSASVATSRHAQGLVSVFGIDVVNITLTGKSSGTTATCTGTAAQVPTLTFQAVLARISD